VPVEQVPAMERDLVHLGSSVDPEPLLPRGRLKGHLLTPQEGSVPTIVRAVSFHLIPVWLLVSRVLQDTAVGFRAR
jgi:hypothetical protein